MKEPRYTPNTHRGIDIRAEMYLHLTGKLGVGKEEALVFIERFWPLSTGAFKNGGDYCRRGHLYDGRTSTHYAIRKNGERRKYYTRVCGECKKLSYARRQRAKTSPDNGIDATAAHAPSTTSAG